MFEFNLKKLLEGGANTFNNVGNAVGNFFNSPMNNVKQQMRTGIAQNPIVRQMPQQRRDFYVNNTVDQMTRPNLKPDWTENKFVKTPANWVHENFNQQFMRQIPKVVNAIPKVGWGKNGLSVGIKQPATVFTPQNDTERFVFGNEPVTSWKKDYQTTKDFSKNLTGGNELAAGALALPLMGLAVMGDLTPVGGAGNVGKVGKAYQAISKSKDVLSIAKTIKSLGISDNIGNLAKKLVNVTDPKVVAKTLNTFDQTKGVAKGVTSTTTGIGDEIVKKGEDTYTNLSLPDGVDIFKNNKTGELLVKSELEKKIGEIPKSTLVSKSVGKVDVPKPSVAESILNPKPGVAPTENPIKLLLDKNIKNKVVDKGQFNTVNQAKRIFKQTGEAPEFTNTLRNNAKVVVAGDDFAKVAPLKSVEGVGKKLEAEKLVDSLDLTKAKSQNALSEGMTDMFRNTERAFGKDNPVLNNLIRPLDKSKGDFARDVTRIAEDLKKNIVEGMGIKKGSKESSAVQQFGEGLIKQDELVKNFGKEKATKIVEADKWFRSQYDKLLGEVNAVRAKIYPNNPDKIIPRRDDYYRHFQELSDSSGIKNLFDNPANIPSEIAGKTEMFKPKTKWLSFAQKRLGNKTDYDAVGGFLDYANAQAYAKNIDPHVEKMRNFTDALATKDVDGKLQSYITSLRGEADRLAGKTAKIDRAIEGMFGRRGLSAVNWLNRRVKANAILGNVSSAISQVFNLPNGLADAGYGNSLVGAKNMMKNILKGDDAYKNSNFITERFLDKTKRQFDTGLLKQPKKFAVWLMTAGDELGTKLVWNAEYAKYAKQGLPENKVIQMADEFTRKMVGGRGIGEVPLTLDAKATQLIAPFMVEVNNMWKVQKEFLDEKQFGKLVKLYMAGYLMNKGAEKLRGSDVIFDPIQASMEAFDAYQNEDDKATGLAKAGGRLAGEVLSNVPGGQYAASMYPEYGVGGMTRKELFGKGDPTRFGASPLFASGLADPLYKLAPPWGGQQIKRTLEGVSSSTKGYAEDKSGNVQFPIDKNPANIIRAGLFGKYSTTEGQDYTKNEKRALGDTDSAFFKAGDKGIYEQAQANRKADEQIKSMKGEPTKVQSGSLEDGMVQLENGKIGIKIDGEVKQFKDKDEAKAAVLRNEQDALKTEFEKSGKNYEIKGDKVYRRKADGGVDVMTKDSYDYKLGTAKLSKYKRADDINSWMKQANSQLDSIERQINDPNVDELDKVTLEEDYNAIFDSMEKYAEYGGFKKPKKGKSAASKISEKVARLKTANETTSSTYKALQELLRGTEGKARAASKQIGRKVSLRKITVKKGA